MFFFKLVTLFFTILDNVLVKMKCKSFCEALSYNSTLIVLTSAFSNFEASNYIKTKIMSRNSNTKELEYLVNTSGKQTLF